MTDKSEVPRTLLDHSTVTMVQPHVHPLKGQVPGKEPVLGPTLSHVHRLVGRLREALRTGVTRGRPPQTAPVAQWLSRSKVT